MKFRFYNKNYHCIDYRKGTILCEVEPFDPEDVDNIREEYKEKYLEEHLGKYDMSIYYQGHNSGVIDLIVGFSIDDNSEKTIENEVKRLIMSGYIDDGINGIEQSQDEYEEYFWEKLHKEEMAKNN
jgi:hypothetical protein